MPSPTAAVAFPLTIEDADGGTHTYDAAVENVGCLWQGCIENLADMGLPIYASPASFESVFYFPVGVPQEQIADAFNAEAWAATETETIFISVPPNDDTAALAEAMDLFFLEFYPHGDSSQGLEANLDNLRAMGQVLGRPDLAEAAIARWDAFIAGLKAKAPADAADREIIFLFYSDDGTYSVMPFEIPFCDALASNGLGKCANPEGWSEFLVSAEAFLEADPEWIAYGVFDPATQTWEDRDDPVWQQLGAVKAGQVYDAGNRYYCCSLRGLEHALQEYAHHVWGEAVGIPAPGPVNDFDPTKSPLLAAG